MLLLFESPLYTCTLPFYILFHKKSYLLKSDFPTWTPPRNLTLYLLTHSDTLLLLVFSLMALITSYQGCAWMPVTIYYSFPSASLSAPKAAMSILISLLILKHRLSIWHALCIQFHNEQLYK